MDEILVAERPEDDALIEALLQETSLRKAAEKAGVTYRVIQYRMMDPSFADRVNQARILAFNHHIETYRIVFGEALERARAIIANGTDTVAVKAIAEVIKFGGNFIAGDRVRDEIRRFEDKLVAAGILMDVNATQSSDFEH